jgi:hypothetical protein
MPNILELAASVDLAELSAGMDAAASVSRNTAGRMSADFQALATESESAVTRISGAFVRSAEASLDFKKAQTDLRAATKEAAAAEDGDSAALAALALAKLKAAQATAELAAAEAALKTKTDAESFSLGELTARLTEVAEGADIASLSTASAFGALGAVLGGAAFVALAGAALNKFKETEIELAHMSEATGISVSKLVQLQSAMTESGAPTDRLGITLQRLSKAIVQAADGSPQASEAFKQLGVDTSQWAGQLPSADAILLQLADHFHSSSDATRDLGDSTLVLGRNTIGLVGFLKQGSAAIEEQMAKYKGLGDAKEADIAPAQALLRLETEVSAQFSTMIASIFPELVAGIRYTAVGFESLVVGVKTTVDVLVGLGLAMDGAADAMEGVLALSIGDTRGGMELLSQATVKVGAAFGFASEQISKDFEDGLKRANQILSETRDNAGKGIKAPEEGGTDNKLAEAQISALENHQKGMLAIQKSFVEAQAQLGAISAAAKLEQLQKLSADEIQVERDAIAARTAIAQQDPNHPEKVAALNGQLLALEDRATAEQIKSSGEIVAAKQKDADKQLELAQKLQEAEAKTYEKQVIEQLKPIVQHAADVIKAQGEELSGEEAHVKKLAEIQRLRVDAELTIGQITRSQHTAMLLAIEQDELASELRILQQRLALEGDGGQQELALQQKIQNQIQAIKDAAAVKSEQILDSGLKKEESLYARSLNVINRDFEHAFSEWIDGTKRFSAAFEQMGLHMVDQMVTKLIMLAIKWAEHELLKTALTTSGNQARVISNSAAAAQTSAIDATTSLKSLSSSAASAAGKAYDAVVGIPIIGPVLAPAAAAAAFAAVLGFGALVSAERGAVLGSDSMAMLHANEMVLPAPISKGMQDMISNSAANGGSFAGGSGGNIHNHVHIHNNGGLMDKNWWNDQGDHVIRQVRQAARDGRLKRQ